MAKPAATLAPPHVWTYLALHCGIAPTNLFDFKRLLLNLKRLFLKNQSFIKTPSRLGGRLEQIFGLEFSRGLGQSEKQIAKPDDVNALMTMSGKPLGSSSADVRAHTLAGAVLFHIEADPIRVVSVLLVSSPSGAIYTTWSRRRNIDWRELTPYVLGGTIAYTPIGDPTKMQNGRLRERRIAKQKTCS